MRRFIPFVLTLLVLGGCSGSSGDDAGTVTLVTHGSFRVSRDVLAGFEQQSGLKVRVVRSADAGTLVNQAILSKGRPQGDVLYGVDNTFLSRAVDAGVFAPYQAPGTTAVSRAFDLDPAVTPIDYGDVCVNYDRAWYRERNLEPPQTLADLTKPAYRDQLVVENPAISSPGLAFLLASVASFGDPGWVNWWRQLRANGALVVDTWDEAYNQRFTIGSRGVGDRPLVVSYASSPPAEVVYATDKNAGAPTAALTRTCFRQVEFAGLLAGAKNPAGGRELIDFMLSPAFQKDMPLQMFVLPVRPGTPLPAVFSEYAQVPAAPLSVPAATVTRNRDAWISAWTAAVLG